MNIGIKNQRSRTWRKSILPNEPINTGHNKLVLGTIEVLSEWLRLKSCTPYIISLRFKHPARICNLALVAHLHPKKKKTYFKKLVYLCGSSSDRT